MLRFLWGGFCKISFAGWHILLVIRYWDLEMSRRDVVLTRGTILNGFLVRCVEPGPGEFWFTN